MGYKVQVYIYDLTQGMARSLGPALLGNLIFYTISKNLLTSKNTLLS